MREKRRPTQSELARRFGDHALLSTFIAPLPPLIARGDRNLGGGLEKTLPALSKLKKGAVVQVSAGQDKDARRWHLTVGKDSGFVAGAHERPSFEIIASEEILLQIFSGELSPLEAFGEGRFRVRGDLGLAGVAVRALQNR